MIHGKEDLVIPVSSVQSTGEQLKGLNIFENNAHMIPIESPKEYEEKIAQFIGKWWYIYPINSSFQKSQIDILLERKALLS